MNHLEIIFKPSKFTRSALLYSLKFEDAIIIACMYNNGLITPISEKKEYANPTDRTPIPMDCKTTAA